MTNLMFKFVHVYRLQGGSLYPPVGITDEITSLRDKTKSR